MAVLARARSVPLAAPDVPAKDMAGLVAYLKAKPASSSFGSPGAGTLPHVGGELLNRRLGVDMQHVPFSGTPPAMMAMMSGQITLYFNAVVTSTEFVNAGKAIALGVAGSSRVPSMPKYRPSANKALSGVRRVLQLPRAGDVAQGAAGGGCEAVRRHQEDRAVAEFSGKIAEPGFEPLVPLSSEQFSEIIAAKFNRNGESIRSLNIKP